MHQPLACPMIAMAALTYGVLLVTFFTRVAHVRSKGVRMSYFKTFQAAGAEIPEALVKTQRHFSNLFEMPVLFYAATLLVLHLGISDDTFVTLAWVFVAARLAHAVIHITYNNVMHRMLAFMAGVAAVGIIWVRIGMLAP